MDQDIKIVAEPGATPNTCKFVVDREVLADEGAYFPASDEAEGSPLAEQLFAVDDELARVRSVARLLGATLPSAPIAEAGTK